MHYLVTGGAGYIGSHLVRALIQNGNTATILDNFSTGHRWATQGQAVIDVDLRNLEALRAALREGDPAILVADASRAREVLGWTPVYTRLEEIVASAWAWEGKAGNEALSP